MLQEYKNLTLKRLNKIDIPQIYELQNSIFAEGYTEDKLRFNSISLLQDFFKSEEFSLGLYDNNCLVAVGLSYVFLLQNEILSVEELKYICDIENINVSCKNKFAIIKLVMVKKEYRGNNIQLFLLRYFEKYYKKLNIKILLASVSPQNFYSIKNFKLAEYKTFKTKKLYNNNERFVMIKKI